MTAQPTLTQPSPFAIWGEARYGLELARLMAHGRFRTPRRQPDAPPVLLIPGFMAGDSSLSVLRGWLQRRGHRVWMSGIRANVDCSARAVARLEIHLRTRAAEAGGPLFLIGQSRGGALARCLAVHEPQAVSGIVMLGSPVCDPLAVAGPVLRAVRSVARLGDLGLPGMFSSSCKEGECCAAFHEDLGAPLAPEIRAAAVYSRSDAIVDWRACLDPYAEPVEVHSSHTGMAINHEVYGVLERVLGAEQERAWSG
jgi:triacylglycerol lipase